MVFIKLTEEEKKERRRIRDRKRYVKSSRIKLTEEEVKERRKINTKKWKKENKEKVKAEGRKYYQKNKERLAAYQKSIPERTRKSKGIWLWKIRGLICDDYNELYEKYINTTNCELCDVELTTDRHNTKTTRCLDHDHYTGLFRNVVCHTCNSRLPKQYKKD
tara:strand:+ start:165 stop:650 length:486 start_codon:yes stop_codon:yes gene_type:complete